MNHNRWALNQQRRPVDHNIGTVNHFRGRMKNNARTMYNNFVGSVVEVMKLDVSMMAAIKTSLSGSHVMSRFVSGDFVSFNKSVKVIVVVVFVR